MRSRTLLLTLPLLLMPVGPGALGADETPATPGEAQLVRSTKITLEDAGESPKTTLRYAPSVGDLQTIVVSISMSVGNQMGNLPMPTMKLPTTVSTLTARVDEVADGRITATVRVDESKLSDTEGVEPMIVKQLESTIGSSVGQKAKMVISDRGLGQSISFNEDAKADPSAAQTLAMLESTLNMLATPLPEEPIGPGARWTAVSTVQEQAVDVHQTMTYTLKSVTDGVIELEVKIEQSAEAQDMSMPGAPPGTQVKLTSLALDGSGTTTLSLKHVAPTEADLTSKLVSEIDIKQSNGGDPQHFKQTMDSHATLTQKAE